jgi:hypothetical protein
MRATARAGLFHGGGNGGLAGRITLNNILRGPLQSTFVSYWLSVDFIRKGTDNFVDHDQGRPHPPGRADARRTTSSSFSGASSCRSAARWNLTACAFSSVMTAPTFAVQQYFHYSDWTGR